MSYAQLNDITDSAIRIDADLLARAEQAVNVQIAGLGFDVSLISGTTDFLKELTVLTVCKIACLEQANGEESPLIPKFERYKTEIDALLLSISNKALGITDPTAPNKVYVALL